jgi:putative transposase
LWIGREAIQAMKALHDYDVLHSHAFVLMPDHLHWLISVKRDNTLNIVEQLKAMSERAIARRFGLTERLWQQGFSDVAIRDSDTLIRVARHVVANPLRAELVQHLNDYPHWDAEWIQR